MHRVVLFALLAGCVLAGNQPQHYSFSPPVGSGSGSSYVLEGEGKITAVRVWEYYWGGYVYGLQFRFGYVWSNIAGHIYGQPQTIELFDDEAIVQISGKYNHNLQSVVFSTSRGRSLYAGQPSGHSFNMYPSHPDAELRMISGRFNGPITSIGAHWGVVYTDSTGESVP